MPVWVRQPIKRYNSFTFAIHGFFSCFLGEANAAVYQVYCGAINYPNSCGSRFEEMARAHQLSTVVRRFFRNRDIMRVAFLQASPRDPDKTRLLQVRNILSATVAHASPQSAQQLINGI